MFWLINLFFWNKKELQKQNIEWTQYIETLSLNMDYSTKQAITNLPIPLCMCKVDGVITWYNKKFSDIAMKKGLLGTNINKIFEQIDLSDVALTGERVTSFLDVDSRKYRIVYYVVITSK